MGVVGQHRIGTMLRAMLVVGWMLLTIGCQSAPFNAMRGARYYVSGTESLQVGDSTNALQDLLRAAELVPLASEIQNHLGLAYWAEGDQEQARIAFDRAIELDCGNAAALRNRFVLEEGGTSDGG